MGCCVRNQNFRWVGWVIGGIVALTFFKFYVNFFILLVHTFCLFIFCFISFSIGNVSVLKFQHYVYILKSIFAVNLCYLNCFHHSCHHGYSDFRPNSSLVMIFNHFVANTYRANGTSKIWKQSHFIFRY